jgi:hypothetical protein
MPKPPSPLDYLKENHPEYTLWKMISK